MLFAYVGFEQEHSANSNNIDYCGIHW